MADAALGIAINKILTILDEERTLLGGLGQEIQLIGDEFGQMKAFLQKMTDLNREDDPQLTEWMKQVTKVSCEAENIIDEFASLFAGERLPCLIGSTQFIKNWLARRRLGFKLQKMKARIKNISEIRIRYESNYDKYLPLAPGINLVPINDWRQNKDDDAHLVEEAELVGIDGPKKHLISQLIDDVDSQLKVIAVLGMGGLGKTTLVKQVFEDAAVRKHFQILLWVSISQKCDFRNLLKKLIQQLVKQFNETIPPEMDLENILDLKKFVKEFFTRERYAVVFDDVWDPEFWNSFKPVLTQNSCGGNRVLFTTRIADVAKASTTESQGVYEMGYLNSKDSRTLFHRKVFKDKDCPDYLWDVAESVLAKCGGLPLAILAMGGLMVSKDTSRIKEWEQVKSSLRDEFGVSEKFDRIKRILALSYDTLPRKLKNCLLHTSIYLQDQEIQVQHLIHLLVVERVVEPVGGLTAEETAWGCLRELANRSLIQLVELRCNGVYNRIRINGLLREFIASMSKEQNMATIISSTTEQARSDSDTTVRRLVFHHNLLEIKTLGCIDDNCRAIINFGEKRLVAKAVIAKLLASNFLTFLDLRGMDLPQFPKQIFKLFQLKFLGMSGKRVTAIPKSISKLQKLQFLFLAETDVKKLPKEIKELNKELRHLELCHEPAANSLNGQFPHNGFNPPSGMGELIELQTLCVIDVTNNDKSGVVNKIGNLSKLRKLQITNLRREDGQELCTSIQKLDNLQELVVASSVNIVLDLHHSMSASALQSLCWLRLYGRLEKIPPWIENLRGLERLRLSLSNLADDPLETLQHLPNLFDLCLAESYVGDNLCFKAGSFLKLKSLLIRDMKGLKRVQVQEGAMPGVNQIALGGLVLLDELPAGIENLIKLQRLHLWDLSSQLMNKLDNAPDSEDWRKISRIPFVLGYAPMGQW